MCILTLVAGFCVIALADCSGSDERSEQPYRYQAGPLHWGRRRSWILVVGAAGREKSSNKVYVGNNVTLAMGPEHDLPIAADNLAAAKQMPVDKALQRVTALWDNRMASDRAQALDNLRIP